MSEEKPKKMLLETARMILRLKHYSIRTERSYLYWMRRYIVFHNKRPPREMGVPEIEAFLAHIAINEEVAGSTQNQAFNPTQWVEFPAACCEILKKVPNSLHSPLAAEQSIYCFCIKRS